MATTEEYLLSLQRDKQNIINSVKQKGVEVPENATFTDLVGKVDNISTGIDTSDGTVTENDIREGKIGYSKDTRYVGNMNFTSFDDYNRCLEKTNQIEGTVPLQNPYFITDKYPKDPKDNYSKNDIRCYIKSIPNIITVPNKRINLENFFENCINLEEVNNFDVNLVQSMRHTFKNCKKLRSVNIINTSDLLFLDYCFEDCELLENIKFQDISKVAEMNSTFYNCKKMKKIPNIASKVLTKLNYTFAGCESLTEIPLFDTSKVTQARGLFKGCKNLEFIPDLDFTNCGDTGELFCDCLKLKKVPNISMAKTYIANKIFYNCKSLTEIESFSVPECSQNLDYTFGFCDNLKTIKEIYAPKANGLYYTFSYCTNLENIPFFDISTHSFISYPFQRMQ